MHFIEGETVHASANRVGVSRRQAHRDLRLGIERVAQVLLAQQTTRSQETLNEADPSTIQAEMAQLQSQPEIINLRELLNRAVETVALLAAQQDVDICLDAPIDPPTVAADPVIAEQVLVDILSRAVGQAHPGTFRIELTPGRNRPTIQVRYFPDTSLSDAPFITPVLTQLVERLGWECAVRDYAEGEREAVLRLSISRVTVLVVDDNRGLIELLQRYLGDCGVHIIAAASGEEGLALARENEPDAIVLDVMMPGMHGWEVLQRLRNHPTTAGTPVIICSVFNNPSLAYSLGASALVPKPVSRHAILKTLQELDILSPEM